jgi:hypothetical protein
MKKTYVALTGGLGNQLFQYAAGRSIAKGGPVYLLTCLGIPRSSKAGPDIFEFDLGPNIVILPCTHKHVLSKKAFNLLMSLTVGRRRWISKISIFRGLVTGIASLVFNFELRINAKILPANGIGFSSVLETRRNLFPIGYFQSFKFVSPEVRAVGRLEVSLLSQSDEIDRLRIEAKAKNPLVVHVRLGDYKSESSFGILNSEYYSSAIDTQMKDGNIKEIWLFSDEPTLAISRIPKKFIPLTKVMHLEGFSSAQVLEVMRFGYSYVIANSTFSWWGAFLSYKTDSKVIAPARWFRTTAEPLDLIPDSWVRQACNLTVGID